MGWYLIVGWLCSFFFNRRAEKARQLSIAQLALAKKINELIFFDAIDTSIIYINVICINLIKGGMMKIKYILVFLVLGMSNILNLIYLLKNPGLFFNMFKYDFQPEVMNAQYVLSSFVILCDIFLITMAIVIFIFFRNDFLDR